MAVSWGNTLLGIARYTGWSEVKGGFKCDECDRVFPAMDDNDTVFCDKSLKTIAIFQHMNDVHRQSLERPALDKYLVFLEEQEHRKRIEEIHRNQVEATNSLAQQTARVGDMLSIALEYLEKLAKGS